MGVTQAPEIAQVRRGCSTCVSIGVRVLTGGKGKRGGASKTVRSQAKPGNESHNSRTQRYI